MSKPYYPIRGCMSLQDAVRTAQLCKNEGKDEWTGYAPSRTLAIEAAQVLAAESERIARSVAYPTGRIAYYGNLADQAYDYAATRQEREYLL